MELETLTLGREEAMQKWKENIEATKVSNAEHFQELKKVYYQLAKGHRILDLYATLKRIPLNGDNEPRIAIAPLAFRRDKGWFRKRPNGGGIFGWNDESVRDGWKGVPKEAIVVPAGTWKWETESFVDFNNKPSTRIKRSVISAPAPIIPAKYAKLITEGRYVLWEVEKWTPEPPVDPLILKRITANLFAIEARWNLTRLERAVIRGHL